MKNLGLTPDEVAELNRINQSYNLRIYNIEGQDKAEIDEIQKNKKRDIKRYLGKENYVHYVHYNVWFLEKVATGEMTIFQK